MDYGKWRGRGQPKEPTTLPADILERIRRIERFHEQTRLVDPSQATPASHPETHVPNVYRVFENHPKIPLSSTLLDEPAPVLSVLHGGLEALPDSQLDPPHDLKTLSTWLYMSYGRMRKVQAGQHVRWLRACPSMDALYPCEIYVAAFAVEGLECGLYHYAPREFALRQLRQGGGVLGHIKRGRPDLEFLKNVPAMLLISTIYCRTTWRYGDRGYRYALLDAGHLAQNAIAAGTALGMSILTRLQLNESMGRQLIGLADDADFGQAESIQAAVIWNDRTSRPAVVQPSSGPLPPIERVPLAQQIESYGGVLAVHGDCVAPGVGVRELNPPLTELSPIPVAMEDHPMPECPKPEGGHTVRQVMMTRNSARSFARSTITRDEFLTLNCVGFEATPPYPIRPAGAHAGLVRPFWVVHEVSGVNSGVWFADPVSRQWYFLRPGQFRMESAYLCQEQPICGQASAVCYMAANLTLLLHQGGPDAYRLAHLEAGLCGQRMQLAAAALDLTCCGISRFYDQEIRNFLGLEQTGWQCLYAVAIGRPPTSMTAESSEPAGSPQWRG
jgi:SagB-type dehydrogenase family enzyme